MSENLLLPTDQDGVVLRQLATETDDIAYFEAINANRKHLCQFGDNIAEEYQTLEAVRNARLNAGEKIRMGIWDGETFVGTVNATPDEENAEIGYWLDSRHTGRGYATLAARALGGYMAQNSKRVYAEVVEDNDASVRVLERAGYKSTAKEAGRLIFELSKTPETIIKPTIRDTKVGDSEALRPILENWIRDRNTGEVLSDEVASVMKAIDESIQGQNDKEYVIAEDGDGNIVGVMGMTKPGDDMRQYTKTSDPVEFINAYVDPAQRGTGTGKLLAKELEEKAIAAGYTGIIVNSGPRYEDTGWAFWNRLYGKPIAIQKDLYGPGGNAPVWNKSLEIAK